MKIDFGRATLQKPDYQNGDPRWNRSGDPRPKVLSNGDTYEIILEEGTPYRVTLNGKRVRSTGEWTAAQAVADTAPTSQKFLCFNVPPTDFSRKYRGTNTTVPKDKCMMLLPGSIDMVASEKVFLSFEILFKTGYQAPQWHFIPFQAWQTIGHPPLAMFAYAFIEPPTFWVITTNDSQEKKNIESGNPAALPYSTRICTLKFTKAKWYKLTWMLQPAYEGNGVGKVKVWLNVSGQPAKLICDFTGAWGYKPTPISRTLVFNAGIYRAVQAKTQAVGLRNYKFGRSMAEV